jgi:phosphoribosyl-ATP pyrophosphohydrolase
VTTAQELAAIDAMGADAQVGMALYTGRMRLADAVGAVLRSDRPDGLWPTVVTDEHGVALGLAWSNLDSLHEALERGQGVYHSRKRGLWVKGAGSGATQELLKVSVDCDRDALRFVVRQAGAGFCHEDTWTCWGPAGGLPALARTMAERRERAPAGSYTRRLFDDPGLLRAKLLEEAGELGAAQTREEVIGETADVLYFALAAMTRAGVRLEEVEAELGRRGLRLTRRPGDAK